MKRRRQAAEPGSGFLFAGALALVLAGAATPPGLAQAPDAQTSASGVTMTMYQVVRAGDGQEFYLNQSKQAVPLPGAGVTTPGVCVYSAPDGSQWYVDSTGTRQSLPPVSAYASAYVSQSYAGSGSDQSGDQPPVQNNYYYNQQPQQSSGSSSSSSSSGGGFNLSLGIGGIPYGIPMYWGAAGPYYYGAGGAPVYVNRNVSNVNQFSEFNQETNNWSKTNNNYWNNRNTWNHNNWNNHWGENNWPGKDHGFPPPNDRVPGRMYASNPADNQFGRNNLDRLGGGQQADRFDGNSGGGDRFGSGRFGGEADRFGGGRSGAGFGERFGGGRLGGARFGGRR